MRLLRSQVQLRGSEIELREDRLSQQIAWIHLWYLYSIVQCCSLVVCFLYVCCLLSVAVIQEEVLLRNGKQQAASSKQQAPQQYFLVEALRTACDDDEARKIARIIRFWFQGWLVDRHVETCDTEFRPVIGQPLRTASSGGRLT
jgi:hypothetical protein